MRDPPPLLCLSLRLRPFSISPSTPPFPPPLPFQTHAHIPTIAPICIGLAVTGAHFVAIPVDNCSINPARSFGACQRQTAR